jgi:hypothetical protein
MLLRCCLASGLLRAATTLIDWHNEINLALMDDLDIEAVRIEHHVA